MSETVWLLWRNRTDDPAHIADTGVLVGVCRDEAALHELARQYGPGGYHLVATEEEVR